MSKIEAVPKQGRALYKRISFVPQWQLLIKIIHDAGATDKDNKDKFDADVEHFIFLVCWFWMRDEDDADNEEDDDDDDDEKEDQGCGR